MISFSLHPPPDLAFTEAKPCSIHQDCLDEQGIQKPIKGNMNVDDNALAAPYHKMSCLCWAAIMAIFTLCSMSDE